MPNYVQVKIADAVADLAARAQALKAANKYDPALFDALVIAEITKLHKIADGYVSENARFAEGHRRQAQQAVDMVEKLLKIKAFGAKELAAVEQLAHSVGKHLSDVREDNSEITDALVAQYRGAWPRKVMEVLADKTKVKPFEDQRSAQITLSSTVMGLTRRLEEYEARCAIMLKQARAAADAASQHGTIYEDLKAIDKSLEKQVQSIDTMELKSRSAITAFTTLKAKKTYDANDLKLSRLWLPTIQSTAKQMRGTLKTMELELESLMKRAKATPGFVEATKGEVKKAEESLKATQKRVDAFSAQEKTFGEVAKKIDKAAA